MPYPNFPSDLYLNYIYNPKANTQTARLKADPVLVGSLSQSATAAEH